MQNILSKLEELEGAHRLAIPCTMITISEIESAISKLSLDEKQAFREPTSDREMKWRKRRGPAR
jgi:hypothetical protein